MTLLNQNSSEENESMAEQTKIFQELQSMVEEMDVRILLVFIATGHFMCRKRQFVSFKSLSSVLT